MKHTKIYQKLVKEWSPKNNSPLDSFKSNSTEMGIWRCKNGHEWRTTIKGRYSHPECKCPFCAGTRVILGINDVATLFPSLIAEWHPTLNGNFELSGFSRCSEFKAWWKCKNGHEWCTEIKNRTRGAGCPVCNGRIPAFDDNLAIAFPHVAALWNYDRNEKTPEQYRPHSSALAWWKCQNGHEWYASIHSMSRYVDTTGCPYCSGKRPEKEVNDLATLYPALVEEWDYELNDQEPYEFTVSSNKKAYWICPKGHRYKAMINNRTKGRGCSLCKRGWKH